MPSLHTSANPNRRWLLAGGIIILLLLVFLVSHLKPGTEPQAGKGGKHPVSVVLTTVGMQTVPLEIKTIGNVESVSSVTLKPQIDGQVTGIYFHEGDLVQKGQLLFTIDTRPIEATIAQAQATVSQAQAQVAQARAQLTKDEAQVKQVRAALKRDQAQLDFAKAQEKRFASLLSQQFVSESEYDQAVASSRAAAETVKADRAAVQNAEAVLSADAAAIESAQANVRADQALVEGNRIKLAYGSIRAPLSGRTGSLKVHQGDTVQSNNTALVSLDQINPIFVGFSIPEQSLSSVSGAARAKSYPVSVKTRENPPTMVQGHLNFMENTVDTSTGTIRLKASFENQNHLWPGQFVDVTLYMAEQPNAVVIPSQAIQSGQAGDYVFVANNGTANLRTVIVDRVVNDLAVIASGLKPGEQVVTDGQFQLSPGSPIRTGHSGQNGNASSAPRKGS